MKQRTPEVPMPGGRDEESIRSNDHFDFNIATNGATAPNLLNDPVYIQRRDWLRLYLQGEVELTEADKQRAAEYRERSRAMLQGRVTKLVPDDRLERIIQSGGAA